MDLTRLCDPNPGSYTHSFQRAGALEPKGDASHQTQLPCTRSTFHGMRESIVFKVLSPPSLPQIPNSG